jgi:2-oxoglutarate dehydrogenase E2 component (dihydrolipoamide succinyltransferase)
MKLKIFFSSLVNPLLLFFTMQYSRATLRLPRALASKSIAVNVVRNISQVRNFHVQVPASLYTVGYDRLK